MGDRGNPNLAGLLVVGAVVVGLTGCQSGIGPDPRRSLATSRAYETRVVELEGRIAEQESTIAALTPAPTATTVPLADRWRVELGGPIERRASVGAATGLTPVAAIGEFVIVPLTVTNLGERPTVFNPTPTLVLVAADGTEFGIDGRATAAAYLLDFGLEPAFGPRQPGLPYPDVAVFDVPPEVGELTLSARDGSFTVRLPDSPAATPQQ